MGSFTWTGWEAETDLGNIDDREGVHFLTILDPDGEEYAVIIHRASAAYPLGGALADEKIRRASRTCAALNAAAIRETEDQD